MKAAYEVGDAVAEVPVFSPESASRVCLRAFEDAPIGMALVSIAPDSWDGCLRVNRALCELTGYPPEKLETSAFSSFVHPDDVERDAAAVTRLMEGDDGFQLEQRLVHADGHLLDVVVYARLIHGSSREPPHYIRQIVHLQGPALTRRGFSRVDDDPLTLLDRGSFLRELSRELARARRHGGGGALVIVELDQFAGLNDSRRYKAGDETLRDVAVMFQEELRETDIFGQVGDDELAALLPLATEREAAEVARRIAAAVGRGGGRARGTGQRLACGIGIAAFSEPSDDVSADQVLADAYVAMHVAKAGGEDRVDEAPTELYAHRQTAPIRTPGLLRRAVASSRFALHCQPVVDLQDDSIVQWELLVRLPDDDGNLIGPDQFLDAAVRNGSILAIDRWVLREATRLIATQASVERDVCLTVNLSGNSVADTGLPGFVERELAAAAIDPSRLVLEVSEPVAAAQFVRTRELVDELAAIGCRMTLDDYGAGAGSIYNIKYLPVDYVKIDGELTQRLADSATDRLVLESVVQMCAENGKRSIAEAVSEREVLEVLREYGVHYAQGLQLGPPGPWSDQLPL